METMQTVIGESHALNTALDHVSNLAGIDRSILVTGERGTGKEIAANRLHFLSRRWQGPFIKLNCASLPENLLDSELFGYEPGAFTGARRSHQGSSGFKSFLDGVSGVGVSDFSMGRSGQGLMTSSAICSPSSPCRWSERSMTFRSSRTLPGHW